MSQLQLSLLILGAVVIGGVVAYNWLQERMHRKRAERAFDQPPADVLFDRVDPGASLDAARVDDRSDVSIDAARDDWVDEASPESSSVARDNTPELTRAPAVDESGEPAVDCVVVFDVSAPLSGDALRAIIQAGGFKQTGARNQVAIIRRGPEGLAMMRTADLGGGLNRNGPRPMDLVPLRRFDIVYVPRTRAAEAAQFVQTYFRDISPVTFGFNYAINGFSQ
jgi:hypothetical protein